MDQFYFLDMVQGTSKHIKVQLTNPLETENITQAKSKETTEEQNNVNNMETKETELSSDENNDDDNDDTILDNSTRHQNNDLKLSSPPLIVKPKIVTFKDLNNVKYNGKVLSHAGKATSK